MFLASAMAAIFRHLVQRKDELSKREGKGRDEKKQKEKEREEEEEGGRRAVEERGRRE